jgi:hypothetical protein
MNCDKSKGLAVFSLAVVFSFVTISGLLAQMPVTPIESGQWETDTLNTNDADHASRTYVFYAQSNDTVLIRRGAYWPNHLPDVEIHNPNGSIATYVWTPAYDYYMAVTNSGWYDMVYSIPAGSTTLTFNCSMLRVPHIPLSYADLDVGTMEVGQSKDGTLQVGSDLDAGFFAVTNARCTVQIRMGQKNVYLVPSLKLYDPNGIQVTNDFPTDYRSEITATVTNPGIYTVVCQDMLVLPGQYSLTMVQMPGTLGGNDKDVGPIISGESKNGTISSPGDLDLAYFNAVSGDVVSVSLRGVSTGDDKMNPVLELYSPIGERLVRTTDMFEVVAVISNYSIVSNGVYSVICKDKEDRYGDAVKYSVEMNYMSGSPSLENIPGPPTLILASQGNYSNRIEVTWNAGFGAIGYDLWRSYSTNTAALLCTNLTGLNYSDYDVTAAAHYFYKIKSRNAYGTSTNFSPTAEGYCGSSIASASRKVLFVGIDNYDASYGPTPLYTCTNDVNGLRDRFFLGDPSNRWSSTNMVVYLDRQATKTTIQSTLNSLAAASSAGDLVVYVHSSHGGQSGGASFICTYDADYTAAELAGDLTSFNSETKIIIIIDACYSGGMYRLEDGLPPPWRFAEETMEHYVRLRTAQLKSRGLAVPKNIGQNIAFMTACDYDELSYCSDFYSRYMGYLIQGCSVQSVDTNSSGQYSFLELHNYAAAKSTEETPIQHAQTFNSTILDNTIARAVGVNDVVVSPIKYNDFDGDNYSDMAVYNTANGAWRIGSIHRWQALAWDEVWGGPQYRPINGDYDGDRATDIAVYSETLGFWSIASLKRRAVIVPSVSFGGSNLKPVSGDYNGDGIYDGALYQTPDGFWYILSSVGAPLVWDITLAGTGFIPVSGDYDGDRMSDLAMYHSSGYWCIMSMTGNAITWGTAWGVAGAMPVSGDYDGDGYSDLAIYQQSTGAWYVWSLKKQAILVSGIQFGGPGFTPVPGDYDGDGSCDLVVYNEATGNWHLRTVSGSASVVINFGGPGYVPVLPAW